MDASPFPVLQQNITTESNMTVYVSNLQKNEPVCSVSHVLLQTFLHMFSDTYGTHTTAVQSSWI